MIRLSQNHPDILRSVILLTAGLLTLVLAVITGYISLLVNPAILSLLAGTICIAILFIWPQASLYILLFYIWLITGRADPGDLLSSYPIVRWGSYVLIPMVAVVAVLRSARLGKVRVSYLWRWIALTLLGILISGFVNQSRLADIVFSIGVYLRYPIYFLALISLKISTRHYYNMLKLYIMIAVLLGLEAVFNYLALGRSSDRTFFSVGTAYGTLTAGIIFIYTSCLVVADGLIRRWRLRHIAVLALFLVSSWIATIRSVFIIIPVLFMVMLLVRLRLAARRRLQLVGAIMLGLVVLALFLPWRELAQQAPLLGYFNPTYRAESIQEVMRFLDEYNKTLLGFGPRAYSPGSIGATGRLFQLMVERKSYVYATSVSVNQFVNAFGELGLAGSALVWLMLFAVLRANLRFWAQLNRLPLDWPARNTWRVVSLAFFGIWFYYAIFGITYYDLWRIDASSYVFWVCAAAIVQQSRGFSADTTKSIHL